MPNRLPKLLTWLTGALLVVFPFNLFLVLNESLGYVNGMRVDYLIPKFFFSELLIVPIICIGLWLKKSVLRKVLRKSTVVLVLFLLLVITQVFSSNPLISFLTALKGLEMGLLFGVLILHRHLLTEKVVLVAAAVSIGVQFVFAVFQFLFQKSLTPYWLFGESALNSSMIGLARSSFGGEERLLAYGTTAHPNILAGISVLLILFILSQSKQLYFKVLLLPIGLILFLTQSLSATLALLIGLFVIYQPKKFHFNILLTILWTTLAIPFFIPLLDTQMENYSISRRAGLMDAALKMIESRPLLGVGLQSFTAVLEKYSTSQEFVRFIQPVHNSLWLYIAETGVVGVLLFWRVCKKCLRYFKLKPVALALIPLLSLDHYLTTNHAGLIILIIFVTLSLEDKVSHRRE